MGGGIGNAEFVLVASCHGRVRKCGPSENSSRI